MVVARSGPGMGGISLSFPADIGCRQDPRRPLKMQETTPLVKLRGGMESMHKLNFRQRASNGILSACNSTETQDATANHGPHRHRPPARRKGGDRHRIDQRDRLWGGTRTWARGGRGGGLST